MKVVIYQNGFINGVKTTRTEKIKGIKSHQIPSILETKYVQLLDILSQFDENGLFANIRVYKKKEIILEVDCFNNFTIGSPEKLKALLQSK